MTCDTVFCKDCEKEKKAGHVCLQEDIESVQSVKELPRCPNCQIAIFRSDGCDAMTCASCQYKFNYKTGEKSGHGSHNRPLEQPSKTKHVLSALHPKEINELGLARLILELEALEPEPDNSQLSNLFINYYKNQRGSSSSSSSSSSGSSCDMAKWYRLLFIVCI